MSIQTAAVLKSYLESGDKPTQAQFIDLVDTIVASNIRTIKYTVGVAGTTGCNHLFTSVANTTEQGIQLGGTTIIPASSCVLSLIIKCVEGLSGAVTGTADVGLTSGANDYMAAVNLDDTDEMIQFTAGSGAVLISASATSVYFSFTPSANWNTITTGKWTVYISYIDNSIL